MTPDQQALIETAKENIRGAKLLMDNGLHNLAVSRAYYAMFYVAEAVLLIDGLAFSKHSAVVAKFGEHFIAKGRLPNHLHRYILDAQDDRHEGDYNPHIHFDQTKAQERIAQAEEFLAEALKLLIPPPPKS